MKCVLIFSALLFVFQACQNRDATSTSALPNDLDPLATGTPATEKCKLAPLEKLPPTPGVPNLQGGNTGCTTK